MDLHEQAKDLMQMQRDIRKHMWAEHNTFDVDTQLAFVLDGEEEYRVAPPDMIEFAAKLSGGSPPTTVEMLLKIPKTWDNWTKYREIVFSTDCFMTKRQPDLDYGHGDMAEDFAKNPDSDVQQAGLICIARDDLVGGADVVLVVQPFKITDGGIIEFDEEIVSDEGTSPFGAIPEVLKEAIASGTH